jgi:hypothetical protein
MRRLGMPVSNTTILRNLKEHARTRSDDGSVRVAGVDEWAWRKGHNYGTIIVDLERRQVVDLLADRSAATTASWFKDHPEVEVSAAIALASMRRLRVRARRRRGRSQIAFIFCRTSARPLSDSSVASRRRSRIHGSMPEMIRRHHRLQHKRIVLLTL